MQSASIMTGWSPLSSSTDTWADPRLLPLLGPNGVVGNKGILNRGGFIARVVIIATNR